MRTGARGSGVAYLGRIPSFGYLFTEGDADRSRRRQSWKLAGLCLAIAGIWMGTQGISAQSGARPVAFRNTDPAVGYVGSQSCVTAGCHEEIGRSYVHSPHGLSMEAANSAANLARVPQPVTVRNPKNNRFYTVYQLDGEMYQSVYEIDKNGRRLYSAIHKIDYATGGERTGYTHLFHVGRWLFQAPLSYYVPSKTWELSPGYAADDVGFTRVMTPGCLVCHNGQPDPEPKRDGMYKEPPFRFGELGVSCEACHGPGALHVREMQARKGRVLAAGEVDTSIVNPAKLPPRLADDICRLCHQAGDAVVVNPGKTVVDFRPGTPLSDTMNIVRRPLTEKERAEANRLETQAPVRGSLEQPLWWKNSTMELSRCYTESHGRMTCSTCHSVHYAPAAGGEKAAYRAACLGCHTAQSCTLKPNDRRRTAVNDYCVACHMEKRPVAGIAHSNDTKHRIVRYPGQPLPETAFARPGADLPGLLWMNRPESGGKFPELAQLDAYWTAARRDPSLWPLWFRKLNALGKTAPGDATVLKYEGVLALGEKKDYAAAAEDFERALQAGANEPEIYLNLATALAAQGRAQAAEAALERGLAEYPYNGALRARLALLYAADNQGWRAYQVLETQLKVFPEDRQAREALASIEAQKTGTETPR